MITAQGYKFNGVDLSEVGLMVNKCSPAQCSQEDYELVTIPGRGDKLRIPKGTRSTVQYIAECTLVEPGKLRAMYALIQGKGKFIHRDEPDKYYNACPQVLTPDNVILWMNKVTITFDCEPYAYSIENKAYESTDGTMILINNGTAICQPTYKLYGRGNIFLTVNEDYDHQLYIPSVDDYVTADGMKLIVHKDNIVKKYSGQIPFFNLGRNQIDTNASKIEIIKNERWL